MIIISLHRYLFMLDLLTSPTRRAANVFDNFPRRTRVSVFAVGAFSDFVRERSAGLMPAGVVIPVLRAHLKYSQLLMEDRRSGCGRGRGNLGVGKDDDAMVGGRLCDAADFSIAASLYLRSLVTER
jgi:hypothetical protein